MTTSGTIVTLLFGLVALLTRAETFALSDAARDSLSLALFFFTMAALLGVSSNAPLDYTNADLDDDKQVWTWWKDSTSQSIQRITATRLRLFRVAQTQNGRKGNMLIAAIVAEVAAVCYLAATVAVILDPA